MASPNCSLKVIELCAVGPPPCAPESSIPLTFFDLIWFRFHPVERLFFYSLPQLNSHPSFFFHTLLPNLKRSLSLALQHFLPLAGHIIWPSHSHKPILHYSPGDAFSLLVAQSDADFNNLFTNSPREAIDSRSFVPHLDSSDSSASVLSLQITLFPNSGICIGITTHHAVFDGKSSTMFIKAWAYLCRTQGGGGGGRNSSLLPELEPFLDREVITDPSGLENLYIQEWNTFDPTDYKNERSLKISSNIFRSILDHLVRATFELKRGDLEKIRKRILQKWENHKAEEEEEVEKPTLSTFVLTTAYVSVCIAKASEKVKKNSKKFCFGFTADCRGKLEPAVPENYFGNCVMVHFVETNEFTEEDGVVMVAKKIRSRIRKIMVEKQGVLDGAETWIYRYKRMVSEGVVVIGVAGSARFGVYGTDFGWGRPEKVEITSLDRGISIGIAESKDGNGGVEVGLVLNRHVMDHFATLFHAEMECL